VFKEALREMLDRCDGGLAGALMGYDGIAVDVYTAPGSSRDGETVGMELSHVLSQVKQAVEALEAGGLEEVTIRSSRLSVVLRSLSDEYFLALAMRPDGNLGKGRYLCRVTAPKLRKNLE
jgi:predicted regulator of Ras-like GTPase activity (Roadblock/LC7/MglB family)